MRIVFLNPTGEVGGAETALLDLLAALHSARPAWTLNLIASAEGPLIARAAALGIDALPLQFPKSLARLGEWGRRGSRLRLGRAVCVAAVPTISYASRLKQQLARFDPEIVHSNGVKMHLLGARTRPARARLIWHLHDYPESRPLTAMMLAAQSHRCAAVLANSDSVASQARHLVRSTVPIFTLYNSVDLDRFVPQGSALDLDRLAGLPPVPPGTLRIGLVGTFARWKGHGIFLEALSRMRTSSRVRGYVIGGPIYTTAESQTTLEELTDRAAAHGLSGLIGFTGLIDDVPSALRALDVVVHASVEPEPFGLVIAEAMACGRAVVASRAGGAAEIAQGGALFHTPGSASELAERLDQLVDDRALRASLGESARQIALRLFSRQRLIDTLIPIYEAVTARSNTVESPART